VGFGGTITLIVELGALVMVAVADHARRPSDDGTTRAQFA